MNKYVLHIIKTARTLIIGVFAVLLHIGVFAQTRDTVTNKTQELNDVVVTGQYGENSLSKSVYKMRVIDTKRIQAQGAFNLRDVLTNELNMRVSQDPVLGSSLSVQGAGGQNIKFLIDGVPIVGRENGNIDLSHININTVERVEIVEGPMSVIYGTDALGGVINIISKKNFRSPLQVGLNSSVESIGNYNNDIFLNSNYKNWNISVSGGRNFFEGFNNNSSSRFMLWKPREQYFANATIGKSFKRATLRLTNSYFNEKITDRDSGTITPYFAYGSDHYYYTQRMSSTLFYDFKISNIRQISMVLSYSDYRRINNAVRKDLVTLQEQLVPDASQQDTTHFTEWLTRGTYAKRVKKISYQMGYEVTLDNISGNQISDKARQNGDYSIFGSTEMRLMDRILIRPGLRYTYNTQFAAPLIPSLNLKYDFTENISMRASYGKGFRAPSMKELYLNFVNPTHFVQGNPNLNSENGDNIQLSFLYENRFPERVFRIEPSFFYNKINDMIDLKINTSTSNISGPLSATYFNVNKFQSTGAGVNMEYRAPHYSLVFGYSYTGTNRELQNISDKTFFFSNEVRTNFNYVFKKPDVNFSVFYKYNGKMQNYQFDVVSQQITLGYIDPFSLLDVSVGKGFFKHALNITAGVKNILNVTNVAASLSAGIHSSGSNTAQAAMGRILFIGVHYTFEKSKR